MRLVRTGRRVLGMRGERLLVVRALAWRLVLPFLKRTLAIDRLVALMRAHAPAQRRLPNRPERIAQIAALVCRPRLLRSQDNCLERSLIAYRYLFAIGAGPELVIGIRRADGGIAGHAWLALEGRPVGEPADMVQKFTEVISFTGAGTLRRVRQVGSSR